MPRLGQTDNLEMHKVGGSNYSFSATRITDLGASEYTLVGLVVDVSGSVSSFEKDIEKMVQEVVRSCQRSPRADNLMLRVTTFNSAVNELHGFRQLPTINLNDYQNQVIASGSTALFDATYNMVKSLSQYGKELAKNDFGVNAAIFVITDGDDNVSSSTARMVAQALDDAKKSEDLESIMPVLIGVNVDASSRLNSYLTSFQNEAGFAQYVALDQANEKTLAKLAGFVSRSISSQSQALGTGGPSQALTF